MVILQCPRKVLTLAVSLSIDVGLLQDTFSGNAVIQDLAEKEINTFKIIPYKDESS